MHSRDADEGVLTRRRLLTASVLAVATGIAGCNRRDDAMPETGTETTTSTGTPPSAGISEPVEPVPEESRCVVCHMYAANYPAWNAQATHENGDRVYFCSPGCLTAYHVLPGHFEEGHSRADLASEWVRAYRSGSYVDATGAYYVLEETESHIDAPMGDNPVPFAAESEALAYVESYEDRTREDIVRLAAFDVPLARRFRARFLPESDEADVQSTTREDASVSRRQVR